MNTAERSRWLANGALVVFVLTQCTGVSPAAQGSLAEKGLRPMHASPIAATETRVYAIAEGARAVLFRPADLSAPWRALEAGPFGTVAGLAAHRDTLYVTDSNDEAVYSVDLRTLARRTLYSDGPLNDPGSIAFARDPFVVDDKTGRLYRLREGSIREISLDREISHGGRITLAASGDDLIVASSGGLISELRGIGNAEPSERQSPSQQYGTRAEKGPGLPLVFAIQKRAFPDVERPLDVGIWNGVVYVVDDLDANLLAFGRNDRRPTRLTFGPRVPTRKPARVAVNDRSIYVLSGTELQRWPRLVPVEVRLRLASVSESMALVYRYLHERTILPVRSVPVQSNVESTLKTNRVILGAYPANLTEILCDLNRGLCNKAGRIGVVQPNEQLVVPDLYSENHVVPVDVRFDGKESLGQIADKQVVSAEFRHWTTEQMLYEMNSGVFARTGAKAREVTGGKDVMAPMEYVRYIVPAISGDASGKGPLKMLEDIFSGLEIISLEESQAVSGVSRNPASALAQEVDLPTLKAQFAALLKRIDYTSADGKHLTKVGVAEEFIDSSHPDLQSAMLRTETVAAVPAGTDPAAAVDYRIRSFEKADHGTMVAGLIGARNSGFEHKGLAPLAMMVSLTSGEPRIGEDIERAVARGVRIFNVSAHYGKGVTPSSLLAAINRYRTALFIVAAGNDLEIGSQQEVCNDFMVYPACWHTKPNVLVVTATTMAGNVILPASAEGPGANWNRETVHLAAPGEGYYASAVGRSYVPARGSSFAAPLVTATAALLYSQSPVLPQPLAVKQRLIYAADADASLMQIVQGGRLNVRRTLADMGTAVLTRTMKAKDGTASIESLKVVVDAGSITITHDGQDRSIFLTNLRRIHEYGGGYRVAFLDGEVLRIVEGARFKTQANAKFEATTADGKAVPVNLLEWEDFISAFQ